MFGYACVWVILRQRLLLQSVSVCLTLSAHTTYNTQHRHTKRLRLASKPLSPSPTPSFSSCDGLLFVLQSVGATAAAPPASHPDHDLHSDRVVIRPPATGFGPCFSCRKDTVHVWAKRKLKTFTWSSASYFLNLIWYPTHKQSVREVTAVNSCCIVSHRLNSLSLTHQPLLPSGLSLIRRIVRYEMLLQQSAS